MLHDFCVETCCNRTIYEDTLDDAVRFADYTENESDEGHIVENIWRLRDDRTWEIVPDDEIETARAARAERKAAAAPEPAKPWHVWTLGPTEWSCWTARETEADADAECIKLVECNPRLTTLVTDSNRRPPMP